MKAPKVLDDLRQLKKITAARIGLPRAGTSIATSEMLLFDLDHARARDAVHLAFNAEEVIQQLQFRQLNTVQVQSAVKTRTLYLQRPDLGRQLDEHSKNKLLEIAKQQIQVPDLAIIIADGLSTRAIHENAIPLLNYFLPKVVSHNWNMAPIIVAHQARVALADEVGELLQAKLSIILIGERPGLSADNSMGAYITFSPHNGCTDAERNCISNIRQGGLGYIEAATQLEQLITSSFKLGLSGVKLKDHKTLIA